MVPFSFAGISLAASSDGLLFWPARRALLVADLHFEKASWYAVAGQMLPPYDSLATVTALADAVSRLDPAEIWCLGDSFHDNAGVARLSPTVRDMLAGMMAGRRWTWIVGNHDALLADAMGGEVRDEVGIEGLILRHEANPAESRPEISGHFHPKLRMTIRGRSVARRCFLASERKLILPAFGALTGGLDVRHPEIGRALGGSAEALVAVRNRMLRFPVAA
ncbi:ligase-associated DNA damage response endonuclease PdeM [Stakelama saccharophila]|uniref:Ligase-associated DNA damage response endonuclease PdeM n=1 Tax=Stakelama saccharophila TaxID=3075605 RepID=A0ABZ0BA83_9SPHN|nr:ligase-associated DNA damage response endonuclease PdeM [Stakelama sp. W311]WNO54268.1 ligase-associated DNA damage response endonuclease PdeM [Stakelama sp. W311]